MQLWNKDMPILSVCIVAYMHERYIANAIESVLNQETQYEYEIIIGDDASTDKTETIILEYVKKYPNRFKLLFLKDNAYGTPDNLSVQLKRMAQGKYILTLEGDDYWTDIHKIQKQVDYLEQRPEYLAVAHNCAIVDENGAETGEQYPECKDTEYSLFYWRNSILAGQTASVMFVNPKYRTDIDWSLISKGLIPGDRLMLYVLTLNGKVGCIQEVMTAYRHVTDQGTSFSANYVYNPSAWENWYREVLIYTYHNGNAVDVKYAERMYVMAVLNNILHGKGKITKLFSLHLRSNLFINILFYIKQWIARHCFGRKYYI